MLATERKIYSNKAATFTLIEYSVLKLCMNYSHLLKFVPHLSAPVTMYDLGYLCSIFVVMTISVWYDINIIIIFTYECRVCQ